MLWLTAFLVILGLSVFFLKTAGPVPADLRAEGTALLNLHHAWETNGHHLPSALRLGLPGLHANGVEVNQHWVSAYESHSVGGVSWANGYRLLRQQTNDTTWRLQRVYSLHLPGHHQLSWRRPITTVTKTP
jgi:hypothetical protein